MQLRVTLTDVDEGQEELNELPIGDVLGDGEAAHVNQAGDCGGGPKTGD